MKSSLVEDLRLVTAENETLKDRLSERDERIKRLERLADEYRSLKTLLHTEVCGVVVVDYCYYYHY